MDTITFYAQVTGMKKWEKAGKLRLYAQTAKHLSVFLDFQDGDVQNGGAIKVFTNGCEGQPRAWHESQRKIAWEGLGRAKFVRYLAAAAYAKAKPISYTFTDSDVEMVTSLLDALPRELSEIGADEVAMKDVEAKARELAAA